VHCLVDDQTRKARERVGARRHLCPLRQLVTWRVGAARVLLGADQHATRADRAAGGELADEEVDARKLRVRIQLAQPAEPAPNLGGDRGRGVDGKRRRAHGGVVAGIRRERAHELLRRRPHGQRRDRAVEAIAFGGAAGEPAPRVDALGGPAALDQALAYDVQVGEPEAHPVTQPRRARMQVDLLEQADAFRAVPSGREVVRAPESRNVGRDERNRVG
jgi:hypothetical protein